jgi:hypothetical protein
MINLIGRANRRCGSQHKQTTKMKTTMSTLAAALLLFTGLSGRAQDDNAEQEQAIARIEKLGGKCELDEKRPGKPVIKVDLRRTKVTDADLDTIRWYGPTWLSLGAYRNR